MLPASLFMAPCFASAAAVLTHIVGAGDFLRYDLAASLFQRGLVPRLAFLVPGIVETAFDPAVAPQLGT